MNGTPRIHEGLRCRRVRWRDPMTKPKATCSVEGCDEPHKCRGFCNMHDQRDRRRGDPLAVTIIRGDIDACIESKIDREIDAPCWRWKGKPVKTNYGRQQINGRSREAHTVVWERENGPVPAGMTLDHECHNEAARREECFGGNTCMHRLCVNPAHLVLKPLGENVLASPNTPAAINAAKTHCCRGHEFTPENTYWYQGRNGNWYRECRACRVISRALRAAAE